MKKIIPALHTCITLFASILVLALLIKSTAVNAQDPYFDWAKGMGGGSDDGCFAIATDSMGNVYSTGFFQNKADFDPGPGVFNLTSSGGWDIFVSKLDPNGNFVWAKKIGGSGDDGGYSITTDATGNVYVTGDFYNTVDFNPGSGVFNLVSAGSWDIFVIKIDPNGNLVWAKQMGGTEKDWGASTAVDALGNVYTTGFFSETADFNPGSGVFNLTSAGAWDIFVSKLSPSGNFIWGKRMGGALEDWSSSITLDATGNVYATGYFSGTADFNPGTGVFNLTSTGQNDIFVVKLSADGNYTWAKRMGGTEDGRGISVATDAAGNVCVTGYFFGTADFNPGTGVFNLTSAGQYDIFVSKLNPDGNFVWAKSIGGSDYYDWGYSIAMDAVGNVYTTGLFSGTVDFDPGYDTSYLTSGGVYISKLAPDGSYIWAKKIAASWGHSAIALGATGNIYVGGGFYGVTDFDIGSGVFNLSSAGGWDAFVLKIKQCAPVNATFYYTDQGTSVQFTNTSAGAATFLWDFGDGNTSTLASPSHTYTQGGIYIVTLIAEGACKADTFTQTVTVTQLPGVRYVNHAATGANNGTSWNHAYNRLQDAIDASVPGDTIWVARGLYKPTKMPLNGTTNKDKTFYINKSIAIYGGFNGTEHSLSQRDVMANVTILSGDLDDNDNNPDGNFIAEIFTDLIGDNANHVIWIDTVSNVMRLDGFTVTAGMAANNYGGGIYNSGWNSSKGSSPVVENCAFLGNFSEYGGGAIANLNGGSPEMTNCAFMGNWGQLGGAVFNYGMYKSALINCTFSNNSAEYGGAMTDYSGSYVLINCALSNNSASSFGGAVFNLFTNDSGATNCTFYGNSAVNGGAIYNYSLTSSASLTNCILWGNSSIGDGPVIYNFSPSDTIAIAYSLLDLTDCAALSAGTGGTVICGPGMIFNQDPLFVDAANGDLHLKGGSPAIDKGDNNAVPANNTTDLGGNPRINGTVDQGVYEYQYPPCTSLTLVISNVTGVPGDTLKIPVVATACFDSLHSIYGTAVLDNAGPFQLVGVEDAALMGMSNLLSPDTMTWACFPLLQACQPLTQGDTVIIILVKVDASAQHDDCTDIVFDGSSIPLEALQCDGNNPPVPVQQLTTVAGSACVVKQIELCGTVTPGVMADISIANTTNQTDTIIPTDSNGSYFLGGQPFGDYIITASKPDLRCITPSDASKLAFWLLGIWQFDPYEKIAADITGDSIVNWKDRDALVTALLNPDAVLPWIFIALKNPFVDPGGYNVPSYSTYYDLQDQSTDTCDLDFRAIHQGSLTPASINCATNNSIDKPVAHHDNLTIQVEPKCYEEGLVEYNLIVQNWQKIDGLQLPLGYDPNQLKFLYLQPGGLGEWAHGTARQTQAGERVLPLLWYATDPETTMRSVEDGSVLLTLTFQTFSSTCPEPPSLYIAEADILPGAYHDGTRTELRLNTVADAANHTDAPRLSQNQPNPFEEKTAIPVYLPTSTVSAEIRITDVHGREIERIAIGGRGEVLVPFRSEGLTGGVYFCSLFVDGKLSASRRMAVQR